MFFKIIEIVMLIRNLRFNDWLCNVTRLRILRLYKFKIKLLIIKLLELRKDVYCIPFILYDFIGNYFL